MSEPSDIQVNINRTPYTVPAGLSVEQALAELDMPLEGIALAINQSVVPFSRWTHFVLQDGDDLHIFQAIAGG